MVNLVTGAPGWLGTEVVRQLNQRSEPLRCLTLEGENTDPLDDFDITEHPGDIRELDSLDGAFNGGVDTVFHCAGIIHPPNLTDANLFYDINADGTKNMLEAARKHGTDHFIYVSSNAAVGFNDEPSTLMDEETPPRPESNYGKSKYEAEQHVRRYHREYGIDYTIVRPCWYYGPRQPERMDRLMEMINGGHPIVFGDGANLRSMTYVPSLVDALLSVMDKPETSKNEVYWITDERPYTTDYIYQTIARILGVRDSLRPVYVPTAVSRVMEYVDLTLGRFGLYEQNIHVAGEMSRNIAADTSKAMAELDYDPPTDLYDGMKAGAESARRRGNI